VPAADPIYNCSVKPLVASAFHGTKATCFAFDRPVRSADAGSGKTFTTLEMPRRTGRPLHAGDEAGLEKERDVKVHCDKLFDLLSSRKQLFEREDGKQTPASVRPRSASSACLSSK